MFQRVSHFFTETEKNTFWASSRAPFGLHFGSILETSHAFLELWGVLGQIFEGSQNEVSNKRPPAKGAGGGGPPGHRLGRADWYLAGGQNED